jgi:hypothetical protein
MTYQTNHLKLPILSLLCARSLSRTQLVLEQREGIRDGMKKRNEPKRLPPACRPGLRSGIQKLQNKAKYSRFQSKIEDCQKTNPNIQTGWHLQATACGCFLQNEPKLSSRTSIRDPGSKNETNPNRPPAACRPGLRAGIQGDLAGLNSDKRTQFEISLINRNLFTINDL